VADYPFTTLVPVLGTVDAPDGSQLTVVDVPGLIEGASEGAGLGHEFLAHLERARLLLHVVDVAAGDPAAQFAAIDRELTRYGAGLDERPQIVVLNKIDLLAEVPPLGVDDERVLQVIPVSAATGAGIPELTRALFRLAPPMRESAPAESELADFLVYRPRPPHRRRYRILRTDSGFRVAGAPPDRAELEEALREAGARRGAEVEIGDETFELD